MKQKQQKRHFLRIFCGTLGASLLGNLLTGKGAVIVGEGSFRVGEGILRAGQDF